jgi:uncharacterized membrane protein YedE/YeeE
MRLLTTYLIGLVFGLGIVISGMANPAKVLNFFDIAGTWDPSLAFVLGGAVLTTFVGYKFVLRRPAPMFETMFSLPFRTELDWKLIGGSAVFGIGWGIAGFCPGAALPVLGTGKLSVIIFVVSLVAGMLLAKRLEHRLGSRASVSFTSNTKGS